jgi:hypothetical protein
MTTQTAASKTAPSTNAQPAKAPRGGPARKKAASPTRATPSAPAVAPSAPAATPAALSAPAAASSAPAVAPPRRAPLTLAPSESGTSPIDRWALEAQKLPSDEVRLAVPFHVHLGEATDVARFHYKYYDSVEGRDGQPARPGLDTVADDERGLNAQTGADILSVREATQQAHTRYLLTASPNAATPFERGRFLVGEMAATLGYFFDDGVENEGDAQLAAVQAAHANTPASNDAVAAELEDYSGLGEKYRSKIDGLGGFDAKMLDEAKVVAAELRDRPAIPVVLGDEAARALALRNRLAMLLAAKMNAVRSAARFVFRHRPEIVREATSVYERRRRAAARRNALRKRPSGDE